MTVVEVIEKWNKNTQVKILDNYKRIGLRASGRFERELSGETNQDGSSYNTKITGVNYAEWLVNGRQPNKNQESIRAFAAYAARTYIGQWIKDKGLNLNPYAVAYNIAKFGIKVPNQYNDGSLLDIGNNIDILKNDLKSFLVSDIKSQILKNGNNNNDNNAN